MGWNKAKVRRSDARLAPTQTFDGSKPPASSIDWERFDTGLSRKRSTESVSCCEDQAELNCRTGAVSASREVPSGESEPLAPIALDQSCQAAWLARPTSKEPVCLAASPTCISWLEYGAFGSPLPGMNESASLVARFRASVALDRKLADSVGE